MNLSISFRHFEPSDAIKQYTRRKLSKLERFLRGPTAAKVTLSVERRKHVAEAQISSAGEHIEAKQASEDMYASIDGLLDKLERQIHGSKGHTEARRRAGSLNEVAAQTREAPATKKAAKKKAVSRKKTSKKVARMV